MFLKVYGSLPPAGSLCQRLPGYCRRKEDARPVHRNDFSPSEMMVLGCPGSSHGSHFASHRKMPCTSLSPPKKTASLTLPMPDPFPTHPAPSSSNHCSCTSTQQAQLLSANFKQKKNASLVLSWGRHLLPTKGRGMAGGRHCWLRPIGLSTEVQGHSTAPVLPKHPLQRCPSDTSSPHLHTFRTTQGVSYTHLPQPTVKSTHFRARIPPAFHLEKNIRSPHPMPVQQTRWERCQGATAFAPRLHRCPRRARSRPGKAATLLPARDFPPALVEISGISPRLHFTSVAGARQSELIWKSSVRQVH